MIKTYSLNGRKYRFEEGKQPKDAVLVEAKVKMVKPEVKIVIPETKDVVEDKSVETKKPRKSTKKG